MKLATGGNGHETDMKEIEKVLLLQLKHRRNEKKVPALQGSSSAFSQA